MGTSMMLVVQKDSEVKVAQYDNWDGDPLSNGIDIFKNLKLIDMDEFKEGISKIAFFDEYETKIYQDALYKPASQVTIEIPDSLMQGCASLIEYIHETDEEKIKIINYIESLDFCNYIYFVNFDNSSFKIYDNNFSDYSCQKCLRVGNIKYKHFERLAKFDLYNLPTLKKYKDILSSNR